MKQYKSQTKYIDILISFEIQFEKKFLRPWGKRFFEKIKAKIIKIENKNKQKKKVNQRIERNIRY